MIGCEGTVINSSLEYTPETKKYRLLSISFFNKNPGTKRVVKCSTPIVGKSELRPKIGGNLRGWGNP